MAKKFDWSVPLYCDPYIAVAIGAEAGIVYERLRWMIQDSTSKKKEFGSIRDDGRRWVDFTYAQLLEWLPIFKSTKALRDVITKLEKAGLIDSETFGSGKWYTISDLDPASLTKIVSESDEICQGDDENRQSRVTKNDTPSDENRHSPKYIDTESTSESTSETVSDSFSSPTSATSTMPVATPAVVEKEEKIESNISSLEDEKLLLKFAQTVGRNLQSGDTRKVLINAVATMRKSGEIVELADFDTYLEFYRSEKRTSFLPSVGFVVTGWPGYKTWLENYLSQIEGHYLPGIAEYLQFSRGDWRWIRTLEPGDEFSFTDGRGEHEYIKQADGSFSPKVLDLRDRKMG